MGRLCLPGALPQTHLSRACQSCHQTGELPAHCLAQCAYCNVRSNCTIYCGLVVSFSCVLQLSASLSSLHVMLHLMVLCSLQHLPLSSPWFSMSVWYISLLLHIAPRRMLLTASNFSTSGCMHSGFDQRNVSMLTLVSMLLAGRRGSRTNASALAGSLARRQSCSCHFS